ncbi:olfactory receptor-like protein OLF4 [Erinaceus europaeus]|uniref:Olfactory receptor n=1 Tax=Erinaceus europaeus TaxID=9365 RepID=A0A1S3AMK5_ERIEU|nr:olfactory receptor-like protein OLF4 [Erinaceus europaeus]
MEPRNRTGRPDFLLLGLSGVPELQPLIFGVFLSMYLLTVLGNLLLVLAVSSDPHLHTPMYFFLSNLALVDICFTSTTVPKMLRDIWTQSKAITYGGCVAQLFFFTVFGLLDNFLLTVMAYDRYVAICHPLSYTAVMSPGLCARLVVLVWLAGALGALPETLATLQLSFCASPEEVPHYFCELPELLRLACSDRRAGEVVMDGVTAALGFLPLAGIVVSYARICRAVLGMSTPGGRARAFSTCGSHLGVVSLFYGTCLVVYLGSSSGDPRPGDARTGPPASVLYTAVTPMLNPFIYSLRNRDIRGALRRLLCCGDTSR